MILYFGLTIFIKKYRLDSHHERGLHEIPYDFQLLQLFAMHLTKN